MAAIKFAFPFERKQKNAGKHKVAQNGFNTVQKGNNITSRDSWNSAKGTRKLRRYKDPTNSMKNLEKSFSQGAISWKDVS